MPTSKEFILHDPCPLADRLREVGFIVNDACLRPVPERIGELHLHHGDGCRSEYCASCVKPLYVLTEVVLHKDGNDEFVEANELCLVCGHCGIIYDGSDCIQGLGVLCYLMTEGANLLEMLKVFEGVVPEDRVDVSIRRALNDLKAVLERGLRNVDRMLGNLADGGPTTSPQPRKNRHRGLKLVQDGTD